ncbi:putative heavy metal-associated domain superfamily [Helianthus annuus]|uniref:Heavy metal-associated domain superfamily n=1 Tax=Helianthus annuus TaxID=4232 RepID=A0A9K3N7E1_HELAN|nr:putative heavy metal-associated domain superfamily [Helianthus annuus]
MSSSKCLSFRVPLNHEKNRIQGLNVSCIYKLSGSKDNDELALLAKISNRSKGLTWVYNPVVYCAPRSDEDVVWLSYWPIGNMLGVGDEVNVDIHVQIGTMIVSGCGASLVYADSEVDQEDNCENNLMKEKEVIGGDLSEFEVTTGGYYLCRRDLFGSETSSWLERLFGDNVYYTVEVVLGVSFNSESEIGKIEKAVSSVMGVESISTRKEVGRITVAGRFDREEMATRVREFGKRVNILYLDNVN